MTQPDGGLTQASNHPVELIAGEQIAAITSRVPLAEFGQGALEANLQDPVWLEEKIRAHDNVLTAADLTDAKTYSRVSPRLGVGFPVTTQTVLHVNWGQFYQQPNLQDLYVSYRFLDYKVRKGGYYVPFGNPNLKPELTTAYEVGVAHQLSPVAKVDLSVYYKDVKDLVQVANIPSKPYSFASFRNKDFATLKGIDLGLTLRRINHVQGNLSYSLSSAKGTGSVSNTQRNIAWTASEPPHQTSALDFDQRHNLVLYSNVAT